MFVFFAIAVIVGSCLPYDHYNPQINVYNVYICSLYLNIGVCIYIYIYWYIYFETDAVFAPCLFPVIYMTSTSVKGETLTAQSLVQLVLQVTYGDIHQT